MADLTYGELQNMNYGSLQNRTWALTGSGSGDSGEDSGSGSGTAVSCSWTESRIAAIENRLAAIESALAKLATSAELTSVKNELVQKCATAEGFATPDDVKLTTTTQTVDLSELKTYGDANWKTAEGFATSEALLTAREDILSTVSLYASTIPENVWNYSEGRTVETATLAQASELAEVRALLDHWTVSGNVLTTFDTSGNTLSVYGLTRDTDGNIIGVG